MLYYFMYKMLSQATKLSESVVSSRNKELDKFWHASADCWIRKFIRTAERDKFAFCEQI